MLQLKIFVLTVEFKFIKPAIDVMFVLENSKEKLNDQNLLF